MKIKDLIIYLEKCKSNYPISDEFQINYKQKRGGYLAKPAGKEENYNQRWHLTKSYLPTYNENEEVSTMYNRALCPEMFIYLLEACGVDNELVKKASDIAKTTIDNDKTSWARNRATINMRKMIPYELFEEYYKTKTLIK